MDVFFFICWAKGYSILFEGIKRRDADQQIHFIVVPFIITGMKRLPLRKKWPYSELFWSAISRIRTEYGEIRSISPVQMRENADQNNSEYGHFSHIVDCVHSVDRCISSHCKVSRFWNFVAPLCFITTPLIVITLCVCMCVCVLSRLFPSTAKGFSCLYRCQ